MTAAERRVRAAAALRRLSRSVALKLFAVVFAVLFLTLGLLGYMNVRLHRQHLEETRLQSAKQMSELVRSSTSYYMLRNDREALRHIVATIAGAPTVTRLRILNSQGHVGFSTDATEVGSTVDLGGVPAAPVSKTFFVAGARHIRTLTPIANEPSCSTGACHAHPASERFLGLLQLDHSLAKADADIRDVSWQFIIYSALGIFITLVAVGLMVLFFVHQPVRKLRSGTERLRRGELGVQIPIRSDDELGELAASFNAMSKEVHEAREESEAWARTLEERVQSKSDELQRAHMQMLQAEKLTSLGKLAAVVAHEINNPLSGILTYAKLLRKWIDRGDDLVERKGEMRESLLLIEGESRRCGDIVRNLLTFARVHPLNISDVDVNRLVNLCIKLVDHKLELGEIETKLELDPALPMFRGDSGAIEQLLLALIMNAIEAMPHEGILRVATSATTEELVIVIEDNGTGIAPEVLTRLFEPFVSTKEDKGVGLGLAVSRSIVDRHNGRIDVRSQLGHGTAFTITLPITAPANAPNREPELATFPGR
ncbi:MAG: ATP-binding protein [Thermoanaerobaculia bacterium]